MAKRAPDISTYTDRIVQWRSSGMDWREIAAEFAELGIDIQYAAVIRYAQSVGIPTGRLKQPKVPSVPMESGSASRGNEAAERAAGQAVGLAVGQAAEEVATKTSATARQTGLVAAEQQVASSPSRLIDPSASAANVPPDHTSQLASQASLPAPLIAAKPLPTPEQLSMAELVAGITPAILTIEQAQASGDPEVLRKATREVIAWLQMHGEHASGEFRTRIDEAIAGLKRFHVVEPPHPPPPPPPPPSAPRPATAKTPRPVPPSIFDPLPRWPVWEMPEPLLHFGGEENAWTLQDACEGVLILGATGSGKTSGSGRLLAHAFLTNCFGGVVLTAKEDETALWQHYAEQTHRSGQLCLVRPGGPFRFNFLDYQANLPPDRGGSVENTVELLHTILESYSRNKRKADSFWANTAKQLLRNLIRVLRAAEVRIDLTTIRRFLSEVPIDAKAAESGAWKNAPTFGRLIGEAKKRTRGTPDERFIEEAIRYWTVDLPNLADKTRSIVVMDLVSMVDLFFDPAIWDLFCGETTITPEAVFDGAILVIDLPIKKYLSIGRIAQIIWKHLFQLAVERRNDPNDSTRRPVFLWADEAQNFWSDGDGLFQATARSSRCATVYLTQNIPAFYAQVGGELAKERVDGFLANLCTKIFHSNNDPTTNHWAAEQLGKSMQYRASVSSGEEPSPASFFSKGIGGMFEAMMRPRSSRVSTNPVIDFDVQPSAFTQLRTGSARHGGFVDAYLAKSGRVFMPDGKCYLKAIFQQEAIP